MFTRFRAAVGIALAQLRRDRTRTALAVTGVVVAVLAATLLGGVGFGVVETGQQKFDQSGRDLWMTGGPLQISPGSVGGFQPGITDAHDLSDDLSAREDVRTAVPLSFQTVYVGANESSLSTMVAVGTPGVGGSTVRLTAGDGFTKGGREHYADGSYDGPMTREVILDPQTADRLGVGVNDTVHLGATVVGAREHAWRVVGVSPTFRQFLGTGAATVPLSELQSMTGTAREDRAAMLTIDVVERSDPAAVEAALQSEYPNYDVRTNQEQLQAVLEQKALVIASGLTLTVLAVIAGVALTVNLLLLLVYQQRRTLAAVRAIGVSGTTLVAITAVQGLAIGIMGGAIGVALTVPLGRGLSELAAMLVGFDGLVQTPPLVLAAGGALAVVVGVLSAAVAGYRVAGVDALEQL
ncbi:ABC transporter permease (plasmid) [Halarchaeum sp. CBA1220]|uniref:ABC transporter permease n=1 Tax=Halarchaeum sp. CBA1220 TaxID=1853682 RepID=UPI000F3A7F00|nr:ABC transporter permease [Halarchaeum sp. CBA1220]QLC35180.1 ABC transporter permease [Halarchaeum sp. CBA1220]